ncbi:MAG: hypothetical protein ABSF61_10355 [Anaerolineales bacterium]|jgi:Ca2+-binding RTX toxin-like protein
MLRSRGIKFALAAAVGLLLVSVLTAIAASNTVPATLLSDTAQGISLNQLKPPECAGITVTNLVVGSGGTINGTGANDLILGSGADETINGQQGSDCIVGGGGNDRLNGGPGNDVILGGPGDDTIDGGGGSDVCYGGPGNNTFHNCQTIHNP